jgi:hypothetical protein
VLWWCWVADGGWQLPRRVTPEEIEKRSSLPMKSLSPGQGNNLWAYAGAFLCVLELFICKFYGTARHGSRGTPP